MRLVRHSLLAALSAAALAVQAQEPLRVKFTLDWLIDGQQAPFFLTQARGYFTQQGVNVTIDAGAGSAAAVQRVASRAYDMGYGDTSALIEHLSKNPDPAVRVHAVYLTQDATPAGIMTLKKNNISSPKDLAGKTIGGPVFDAARKLFPVFAKAQGIDPASVKWQSLQPGLNLTQLVRGQIDAASGFPTFEFNRYEAVGLKPEELVMFNFKDYGVKIYGNAILVNARFMQESPKAVAAFLRAYNRGLKEAIADPEAAVEIVRQREPTLNAADEVKRLRAVINVIATQHARASGLSEPDKARVQHQAEDVAHALGLERIPDAEQIFNPAFLPPRAERML